MTGCTPQKIPACPRITVATQKDPGILPGCRIAAVFGFWEPEAKVRLLLLRPVSAVPNCKNVLIVKPAKTAELHSAGEGSTPSEGTKWRFLLRGQETRLSIWKSGFDPLKRHQKYLRGGKADADGSGP